MSLKAKTDIYDSLNYLNDVLKDTSFVAGNVVTIADFSFVSTISAFFVRFYFQLKNNTF